MSTEDIIGFINGFINVIQCVALLLVGLAIMRMNRTLRTAQTIIDEEALRKKAHRIALEQLTDPNAIVADMEQGAIAREALEAKRRRNIREDAGPHARVYKGPARSSLPGQLRKEGDRDLFRRPGDE